MHSASYSVQCTVCGVHYTIYTVHCTTYCVLIIRRTLSSIQKNTSLLGIHYTENTVYSVQCPWYTIHCTLSIVQCTLSNKNIVESCYFQDTAIVFTSYDNTPRFDIRRTSYDAILYARVQCLSYTVRRVPCKYI